MHHARIRVSQARTGAAGRRAPAGRPALAPESTSRTRCA